MARARKVREPLILFGEGPTEGLFLGLIRQHYSQHLAEKKIAVGHGSGGSSGSVLLELKKKHLDTGSGSRPALVLLDADKGLDRGAEEILSKHGNIRAVFSKPECLEGLLLTLLDDLPSPAQQTSDKLKKHFQDTYLGGRTQVQKNFKVKRHELFPQSLFAAKQHSIGAIGEIFQFLGLPTAS